MQCKQRGPICGITGKDKPDSGTSSITKNLPDCVLGLILDYVTNEGWHDWAIEKSSEIPGILKYFLISILRKYGVLKKVGLESDYPNAIDIFSYYLSGLGWLYKLNPVPEPWQQEIIKRYSKKASGVYKNENSYNWGNKNLRNSLGHFDLEIIENPDHSKTYIIKDRYHFPYMNDKGEIIRHGFQITDETACILAQYLPTIKYENPHADTQREKTEKFEITQLNGECTLLFPTKWLQDNGTPFPIEGKFTNVFK
jgi:hypothetical protein